MGRGSWAVLLLLVVSAWACGGATKASFRGYDGYEPRAHDRLVEVFLHAVPDRPYDAVGVITVDGAGAPKLAVGEAVAVARRVGCDLLVTRSLARELGRANGRLVAQVGATLSRPGAVIGGGDRQRRRDEFVCGVWRKTP